MITTITFVGLVGYAAIILGVAVVSMIINIWLKDWDGFIKDLGTFIVLNAALAFGLSIGTFIFGNLLNLAVGGQLLNFNKIGIVLLIASVVLYIVGSPLQNKDKALDKKYQKEVEEEGKHKYITLKTGQRVKLY